MTRVKCPHCSHCWQEADRLCGANRRCPACQKIVTVVEEAFYERAAEERGRLVSGVRAVVPVACIVHNVRSAYNVGSIFRSADGAGVAEIALVGITPDASTPQVAKTSLGAEDSVPWRRSGSLAAAVDYFRCKGMTVLAAEKVPGALDPLVSGIPLPVAFVLGNEVSGLCEAEVSLCDGAVALPMLGAKGSLNVASAAAVLFYLGLAAHVRSVD